MVEDLTLVKLRTAFKRAEEDFKIADDRYKAAIKGLFMLLDEYDVPASQRRKEISKVTDYVYDDQGRVINYATDMSEEFGSVGRNGRFHEKPSVYYKLQDLEHDHKIATERRDRFLIVCNTAGIKL